MNNAVQKYAVYLSACALFIASLSASASPTPQVKPFVAPRVNTAVVSSLAYYKNAVNAASQPDTASEIDQYRGLLPTKYIDDPNGPEIYKSNAELRARDAFEEQQGVHLAKILKGNPDDKTIALTFDDGPHAKYTLQLLALLKNLDVHATFFVVGKQVAKFPTLVQLEVLEGHEIGNHTFDHVNLTEIPPAQIPYELDECDNILRHTIGTSSRFFRPPGGDYNAAVIQAATQRGYITTLWTDDPGDFNHIPSDVILKRLLDHLHPGGIILLHDGIPQTMEMLPAFVTEARRRGYTFVTMSELASEPGVIQ